MLNLTKDNFNDHIERFEPNPLDGLSSEQVNKRINQKRRIED